MNSFFLSCSLPPNTEGSAEPREAIGASLRTQVKIIFPFLLTLAPSDGYRRHLPRSRGRLAVPILFFLVEKSFTA